MIEVTLGASGLWLGTQTRAGGTATLAYSFFGRSHGQQANNSEDAFTSKYATKFNNSYKKVKAYKYLISLSTNNILLTKKFVVELK